MNSISKIYRTGFLLIASAIIIFAGVDLFYKVVRLRLAATVAVPVHDTATVPARENRRQAKEQVKGYQVIVSRNLFGAAESVLEDVQLADVADLQETSLDLTLMGTIDSDSNGRRAIILDNKTRQQDIYREGDSVQQALVKKILRGKIILHLRGKDEILSMADDKASSSSVAAANSLQRRSKGRSRVSPGRQVSEIAVDASDVDKVLSDINNLRVGVSMRPHQSGGKVDGVMLTDIKKNSIFRKLGLRKNDILERVNGKPITSPEETAGLYSTLRSGEPVSMQLKRGGRRQTINYTLKE